MPKYAQRSDLNLDEKRLIELTDSETSPGVTNELLIAQLGDQADGIIDGYLAFKYVIPVPDGVPIPPIVKFWASCLWRRLLYMHRENISMPDGVEKDYTRAIAALETAAKDDPNNAMPLNIPRMQSGTAPSGTGGALDPTLSRKFGRGKDTPG